MISEAGITPGGVEGGREGGREEGRERCEKYIIGSVEEGRMGEKEGG